MGTTLGLACPAREPHPVLLEQLTQLAAASVAPATKPWWHRLTAKTGAAAVAGVLMISGTTADAEHSGPRMPAPSEVIGTALPALPHHAARQARHAAVTSPVSASHAPWFEAADVHRRATGPRRRHHGRLAKIHAEIKADPQRDIPEAAARLVSAPPSQASLLASSTLPLTPNSHGHVRQRSKSHR